MRLGLCECCTGWTLNPTTEKCPHCHNKVAPLKPLAITEVPDGSRIDVHGDVYGPDGTKYVSMRRYEDQPNVAFVRGLVKEWDEGRTTDYGIASTLYRREIDKLLDLKPDGRMSTIIGGTFRGPPTTVATVTVRIEKDSIGGITITRVD